MSRPVTRRPVDMRAEHDARGACDERATDPGAYRPARPARPVVSRWRPTRYASVDGIAWAVAAAPRAWTHAASPRTYPPARAACHARAAAVGAASREFTVGVWCAAGIAALLLVVVTSAL